MQDAIRGPQSSPHAPKQPRDHTLQPHVSAPGWFWKGMEGQSRRGATVSRVLVVRSLLDALKLHEGWCPGHWCAATGWTV